MKKETKSRCKTMFLSPLNIIIIILIGLVILFSSGYICVDCLGPNCGYCNGCHTQIDCWSHGLIKSHLLSSIILIVIYLAVFLIIYKKIK
jgi:hypothetical protein